MDQKIPPEILNRQKLALIGQAKMRITLAYRGPCISFNGVYASLVHRLSSHDNYAINGECGSLVKIDRFSETGLDMDQRLSLRLAIAEYTEPSIRPSAFNRRRRDVQ